MMNRQHLMKRNALRLAAFSALLLLAGVVGAEPESGEAARDREAIEVAGTWFAALVGGDAEGALAVSAVPFTFDSRNVIETMPELKAAYDAVAEDKGARDIEPTSVQVESSSPEKVVVLLMIDDEGVRVDVQPGDAFRVVGFRD